MKFSDFDVVKKLKPQLEEGLYPVKIYAGANYGDLKFIDV